ncbi:MAG: mandelate racemase/muconate lactonizing enzyme family protein [Casimicrobiaceae bacterium]
MKIERLTTTAYRLPLKEHFMSAKYLITHQELVLTTIETDTGITGTGWCTTVGVGGLAIKSLVDAYLAQLLVGEDPRHTERLWEMLWADCHFAGPGGLTTLAIATIDTALWDIKAKSVGEPLHRLLGGGRTEVPVYASAVNLHLSKDALLAQVEDHLSQGYSAFKLKIGRSDPDEDLDRCRAVRKMIGNKRALMLDVNQKWRAAEAVQRCRAFADINPGWIEEPILSDDVAGHAHVRAHGLIPVAVGEQLCNRFEFWNYVREQAADILQPNVWKVGGITEWMKIAALAQSANLQIAPHNALELSQHLVAATTNGFMVEKIFGSDLFDLGATQTPIEVRAGRITLTDRPGHGVDFDGPALAVHRLDHDSIIHRQATTHAGL